MNTDPITAIPTSVGDFHDTGPGTSGLAPQGQDSMLYNPNSKPGEAGSLDPTPPPPVSQTQDASQINNQLAGDSSGVVFPPAPGAPTNGVSANTSVSNPNPTAEDIINNGSQTTPAEGTNQSLLMQKAKQIGAALGLTTLTNNSETAAGVPALTKTVNDLNTQLEGLNNQATDLQNQASAGGSIQNQEQQDVLGRGVTAAGLAPQTAGDLRKNQIQQSAIASQALTLKSAIYGAQGKLSLAKDAADKAAEAQYEKQQNDINYTNALIDANLPQMNKEEKAQAAVVQAQLAEKQAKIDQAKEDKKTIIAAATATIAAYPNDPAAQYAAQQALAESNKDQPDLGKALGLLSKYPSLATKQAQATIDSTNALANQRDGAGGTGTGSGGASGGGGTLTGQTTTIAGVKVDSGIAKDVQAVLEGRNTLYNIRQTMGRTNAAAAYMQKMRDALATIDPNFDFVASDAGGKFVSTTFYQKATTAITSVLPNIDTAVSLSNQVSRIGVAGVDKLLQSGAIQIGGKKVANFHEAQKLIADEIGLALGQGTVSDMKLQLGFDITDPSMTPEVFASNMAIVKDFVNNRLSALKAQRYSSSVGTEGQSVVPPDIESKVNSNLTYSSDGKTAYLPRSVWSTLGSNMDAVLADAKAHGVNLLIK